MCRFSSTHFQKIFFLRSIACLNLIERWRSGLGSYSAEAIRDRIVRAETSEAARANALHEIVNPGLVK